MGHAAEPARHCSAEFFLSATIQYRRRRSEHLASSSSVYCRHHHHHHYRNSDRHAQAVGSKTAGPVLHAVHHIESIHLAIVVAAAVADASHIGASLGDLPVDRTQHHSAGNASCFDILK